MGVLESCCGLETVDLTEEVEIVESISGEDFLACRESECCEVIS